MEFTGKITPNFNVREIMTETIRKDWFIFQSEAFEMGLRLTEYMQNYINSRRKRRGSTGNLANSITFEAISTAPAMVGWGIGNISVLNQQAPYWYVINYGKTVGGTPFIPGGGKIVPGSFEGTAPSSALAGGVQKFNYKDGSGFSMKPANPVRPINYIQAGRFRMSNKIRSIIRKIKKGL